jgi:hypothetical protein
MHYLLGIQLSVDDSEFMFCIFKDNYRRSMEGRCEERILWNMMDSVISGKNIFYVILNVATLNYFIHCALTNNKQEKQFQYRTYPMANLTGVFTVTGNGGISHTHFSA